MKSVYLFLLISFYPIFTYKEPQLLNNLLIVWNVGQGQWVTFLTPMNCFHFDMGGERYPKKAEVLCRSRYNFLVLSHLDWDHISYINRFSKKVRDFCILNPTGHLGSNKKQAVIKKAPPCHTPESLIFNAQIMRLNFFTLKLKKPNDQSQIFIVDNQVLIPGDSTVFAEKRWAKHLPGGIKILVAGHHGSRTSSGKELLEHLPKLDQVIVSARHKKYGHPHLQVLARFRAKKTPVLKTEDWGSIFIEL
jgi:competence protein ComEC